MASQDRRSGSRTGRRLRVPVTADPHFSADRFGTLDRPTEFPPDGTWGYEASYATWYAVAAWDFEHE